jgi:hypothetical protein
MELGGNMRRLVDSTAGDSVEACVVAGPGDLLGWEVRVTVDADGIPLEVTGRGSDLEAAAAAAMPLLTAHSPAMFGQAEVSRSE